VVDTIFNKLYGFRKVPRGRRWNVPETRATERAVVKREFQIRRHGIEKGVGGGGGGGNQNYVSVSSVLHVLAFRESDDVDELRTFIDTRVRSVLWRRRGECDASAVVLTRFSGIIRTNEFSPAGRVVGCRVFSIVIYTSEDIKRMPPTKTAERYYDFYSTR